MQDIFSKAFVDTVLGGGSVGVPGALRMLETAHRQHGQLPWAQLFTPAITLAEVGFKVSPRLHTLLQADPHLKKDTLAARFFYNADGNAWPVGHVLRNPEYAHVLRRIAAEAAVLCMKVPWPKPSCSACNRRRARVP